MNRFKWYRKCRGGKWYQNKYIFDMGRGMLVVWERQSGGYTLKEEDYDS